MAELSSETKIALLRELTRGPDDVFALRHDRAWQPIYALLEDLQVRLHLQGHLELGAYAILPPPAGDPYAKCWWIAADFDGKRPGTDWQRDVQRAVEFLSDATPSLFVNLSRSGKGAHVRVLFKEPVPAWLARRWMMAWLEEAQVVDEYDGWDRETPSSFDLLVPRQDTLDDRPTRSGHRGPGNLAGSPLQGKLARSHGGTLPLPLDGVLAGDFAPDGQHWDHVVHALDARVWGEPELRGALKDAPGSPSTEPPRYITHRYLPVMQADDRELDYVVKFCAFMLKMQQPGAQSYPLWISLASQLHRFGEAGRVMFHEISAQDPQYHSNNVERKWQQTANMTAVRCDTLVEMGFTCPHLGGRRCNGAAAPSYFAEHTDAEIL